MTNPNLTEIAIVQDRSQSMEACKTQSEDGINHFVTEQKQVDGDCLLTLANFDDRYDIVHDAIPIQDVPSYVLEPRGMTALLDAIGRTINRMGERYVNMHEEERPGRVFFVINTDGWENASREFTKDRIIEMIRRQTDEYNWQFIFLGANQDAIASGTGMGVTASSSATYTPQTATVAYMATSDAVTRSRLTGDNVTYSSDERSAMAGDKDEEEAPHSRWRSKAGSQS